MDIAILGFKGCLGSGLIGADDLLTLSCRMLAKQGQPKPFGVLTVSFDGRPIEDGKGRTHAIDRGFEGAKTPAAIIVPGYVCDGTNALDVTPEIGAAAAWLRRQHSLGAIVCGSCNGVFILGEAGLLEGRRCTTTWWRHDDLKTRYPRADAAWGARFIDDDRVVTAAGALSWIDLSLHVIRVLCGAEAAKTAADYTIVDLTPSTQTVYVPPGHVASSNKFILEAEHVVRQAGEQMLTAERLAEILNVSKRTLSRRLVEGSGETPKNFIDRVRFDTARTLLETTTQSVKELAGNSGYTDETSFRRAFQRYSGMTPAAYRTWARERRRPRDAHGER